MAARGRRRRRRPRAAAWATIAAAAAAMAGESAAAFRQTESRPPRQGPKPGLPCRPCRRATPRPAARDRSALTALADRRAQSTRPSPSFTGNRRDPTSRGLRLPAPAARRAGARLRARPALLAQTKGRLRQPQPPALFERDPDDFVGFGAARRRHLDAVADPFPDQRAGQGRGDRQAAVSDIGLVLADDPEGLFLVGFLVGKRDLGPEFDDRARQFRNVDDLRPRDLVFEFDDPTLDKTLAVTSRVIFGVLRQIAVGAGLGNSADDGRPVDGLEPLQLLPQAIVAFSRH